MRKSLIIYALLLPFLIASSARVAAAVSDAGSSSPWNNPVATASELLADDDDGVSVDNLITDAPRFAAMAAGLIAKFGLARRRGNDADRSIRPARFLLNHSFLI